MMNEPNDNRELFWVRIFVGIEIQFKKHIGVLQNLIKKCIDWT